MKEKLFEMQHARVPAQQNKMAEATRLGICPFCWENLAKWHDAPVIFKGKFWAITANDYPYTGTSFHFMAIYKDHICSIADLAPEAGDELFTLFSRLCQEFGVVGASIVMRFGEMKYNGATVFHLHAQIMSGASLDDLTEKPLFPDSFIVSVLGYKKLEQK